MKKEARRRKRKKKTWKKEDRKGNGIKRGLEKEGEKK